MNSLEQEPRDTPTQIFLLPMQDKFLFGDTSYNVDVRLTATMYTKLEKLQFQWSRPYVKQISLKIDLLRWAGLWELDSEVSSFFKFAYRIYNKFAISVMFVFASTLFADLCAMIDDLSIATDDGCIFAGIFIVIFAVVNCQLHRQKIRRLGYDILLSTEQLCQMSVVDTTQTFWSYLLFEKILFFGFTTLGFILVIALLFFVPLENGALPIRAQYPFDTKISPFHEMGMIVEACAVSIGMMGILGVGGIIMSYFHLILFQLEVLYKNFESCGTSGNRRFPTDAIANVKESTCHSATFVYREDSPWKNGITFETFADDFEVRFKKYLRYHQRLVRIIDALNELFNSSMLILMFSSVLMICLTGFQAVVVKSNFWKASIYFSAAVCNLFYFCWLGNELKYRSSLIVEGQWHSQWHSKPLKEVGNLIVMSTMFTQKSLTFKAGQFFELSFQTFIMIMRSSYSFFALLNTIKDE